MVISVVLDTEYMGMEERKKWFLKMLSEAQKTDMLIITHEYMKYHFNRFAEECEGRFYEQFEMKRLSVAEFEKTNVCYIPDCFFEGIYGKSKTRTKMLLDLYKNDNQEIESYLLSAIDKELGKRNIKKPEYILNCLHVFKFVRNVANRYESPIIPYVFSAIRKVHGYEQTLYMAHVDNRLFNSKKAEELYESWNPDELGFPVFSRQEILGLLGKECNLFLLPLMDETPVYELGVVGEGYHITPEIYNEYEATDDDIFYEAKMYFSQNQITERLHPMQLDQLGIGRKHMKSDPASFVLGCKRVVTIQSQMIMKAAIWNRVTVAKGDALPYAFLMDDIVNSEKVVSESDLNFILFAYFIPDICMFDTEYWRWRLSNPSAVEIAKRNVEGILKSLKYGSELLLSSNRLNEMLLHRNLSHYEISQILTSKKCETDYKYPLSYATSLSERNKKYYSLNELISEHTYKSTFLIENCTSQIEICLQNDIDGFVSIKSVEVNGCMIQKEIGGPNNYYAKNETTIVLQLNERITFPAQIVLEWEGKYYNEQ